MKIGVLLCLVLAFTACTSKRRNFTQEYKYPEWYNNPPTSGDKFYGTGKGVGRSAAVNDALNSIAKQIQVFVSSRYEETTRSHFGKSESSVREMISAEVIDVELHGYKIANSLQTENYDTLVLIEIDKSLVIQNYKDKLKKIKDEINVSILKDDTAFLKSRAKDLSELSKIDSIIMILKSLEQKDFSDFQTLEKDLYLKRFNEISFKVIGDSQTSVIIKNIIKNALTSAGHRLVGDDTNSSFTVVVNDSVHYQAQGRTFLVKHMVQVKVKNLKGEELAVKNSEEVLLSYHSFVDALANTGNDLKSEIKSKGIDHYLNLAD